MAAILAATLAAGGLAPAPAAPVDPDDDCPPAWHARYACGCDDRDLIRIGRNVRALSDVDLNRARIVQVMAAQAIPAPLDGIPGRQLGATTTLDAPKLTGS